jgi:hypothetical protein
MEPNIGLKMEHEWHPWPAVPLTTTRSLDPEDEDKLALVEPGSRGG